MYIRQTFPNADEYTGYEKKRTTFSKNNFFDLRKKGFVNYIVFIVSGCEKNKFARQQKFAMSYFLA